MSEYIFDWIEITSERIAYLFYVALQVHQNVNFDMAGLLALPIPADAATAEKFEAVVEKYRTADH
ncbi:MAG TPA: hypothetical protein VFG47_21240, partial [Geminicoccaceae bacterium]|nr:hypothetical protein [Geminicoccaceae bacterium]